MADTTGRIPLWLVVIVACILLISLVGVLFYGSYSGLVSSLWQSNEPNYKHEKVRTRCTFPLFGKVPLHSYSFLTLRAVGVFGLFRNIQIGKLSNQHNQNFLLV